MLDTIMTVLQKEAAVREAGHTKNVSRTDDSRKTEVKLVLHGQRKWVEKRVSNLLYTPRSDANRLQN